MCALTASAASADLKLDAAAPAVIEWELDEMYFQAVPEADHAIAPEVAGNVPEVVTDEIAEVAAEVVPEIKPEPLQLDEACFPSFSPLIHSCQAYARLSGCRFSIAAFDGIDCSADTQLPVVSDKRAQDAGPLLSAKLQAASLVRSFASRLRSGEPDLIQDLTRAFDLVIKESVRNSMIASCKAADMFPPPRHPANIDEKDCSWDDSSSSVSVTAQRLYNDEVQRLHDTVDGMNKTQVRAKTASFVVEFADEVGVGLPRMPVDRADLLAHFQEALAAVGAEASQPSMSQAPLSALLSDAGGLACKLGGKADKWIAKHLDADAKADDLCKSDKMNQARESLIWTTAALAGVAAVGFAASRIAASRAPRSRASARANTSMQHIPRQVIA